MPYRASQEIVLLKLDSSNTYYDISQDEHVALL